MLKILSCLRSTTLLLLIGSTRVSLDCFNSIAVNKNKKYNGETRFFVVFFSREHSKRYCEKVNQYKVATIFVGFIVIAILILIGVIHFCKQFIFENE